MTQSAIKYALQNLEIAFGVQLFEKFSTGIVETSDGKLLVQRAIRAKKLVGELEAKLSGFKSSFLGLPLYRRITASQLSAVSAVVDCGGYSSAARKLGIAQPTVHRTVKQIEGILDVSLFVRVSKGVEPTKHALTIARFSELIFGEVRQGIEELREKRGEHTSRIAIGSLPLARSGFLPETINRFLEDYPDSKISISDGAYDQQLHALRHGRIDWLVGALRENVPKGVSQQLLFYQPLSVVVRPDHPLIGRGNINEIDLRGLDWIVPSSNAPAREILENFFDEKGLVFPKRFIECGSFVATRELIQRSDRAALFSPIQIEDDVKKGNLAVLIDRISGSSRAIGLTIREDWCPTPIQEKFTETIFAQSKLI